MRIGIIGCGHMGQALLRGIVAKGDIRAESLLVSDKDRKKLNFARLNLHVGTTSSNDELIKNCSVIILAVKPQDVQTVLQEAATPSKGKLWISICAGISTQRLEELLGKVAVIRVMPNMPAQIAQGISAISLGRYARAKDRRIARNIFSCIGEVVEVKESRLDAVTAISGSGPAYFFYLVETLIKTAREMGLPQQVAQRLAIKTALGSALLMERSGKTPLALRKQVTSKGGTTEAAFRVFKKKTLADILRQGLHAAARRSKQLQK